MLITDRPYHANSKVSELNGNFLFIINWNTASSVDIDFTEQGNYLCPEERDEEYKLNK